MQRAPRTIGFHLTLREADRELLDRLAVQQGVSRTEIIARALHLLDVQMRRPKAPTQDLSAPANA